MDAKFISSSTCLVDMYEKITSNYKAKIVIACMDDCNVSLYPTNYMLLFTSLVL